MFRVTAVSIEDKIQPVGIDVLSPRISWRLESDARNVTQRACRIQVAGDEAFERVVWDTGRLESDRSVQVEYAGTPLASRTRYFCRVRAWSGQGEESDWSVPVHWEMGLLDTAEWQGEWIAPVHDDEAACPLLRRPFFVSAPVARARLYATALGLYEAHLNGERVGDEVLSPGWTSYHRQLQYQTYDVTGLLASGDNVLGVVLGNGWYRGDLMWDSRRAIFGDRRAALIQLHIEYEDGSEQVVTSDGEWKSADGPILMSEIYHGETYDARLELPGWCKSGLDASAWSGVETLDADRSRLVAQINHPMRVIEEVPPQALIHTPAGETVIDFGQNMVGWVRLRVSGSAGDRVVLQHAEVLDREGNFYTANLRSARQTVTYICKGEPAGEEFQPHFTFQGFRYVKVVEYPGPVQLDRFVGRVVHSDLPQTGTFSCSEPLLNQLQHNIVWGQKGNFVDVPTDCPQRDERLGWTGDAQVFIRTAIFNMGVGPFFRKWLRDLSYDQHPDGGVPFVIPDTGYTEQHSSAAWGDAATVCPWTFYICSGDERLLREQYASMKAWVEYIRGQGDDEFLWNTGFHFGDWLALDAKEGSYVGATPKDLIATAFYAYSSDLVARAAEVLGYERDAAQYRELHRAVAGRFQEEFVTVTGRLVAPTQTAHVLALAFGLVKAEHRPRVAATLAGMIEENGFRLTTGFVGTPYLCDVLSHNGYHDVACKLVRQTEYPSWLYSVKAGATTIWEHWDGIRPDGTFWSEGMNSFNHYAYGSVGDWLYRVLAGLDVDADQPGYRHILIHPHPDEGLDFAQVAYQSAYGQIRSGWRRDAANGNFTVEVEVPVNTTATVLLPQARLDDVQEGEAPVRQAPGVHTAGDAQDGVELRVGSGVYRFTYPSGDK